MTSSEKKVRTKSLREKKRAEEALATQVAEDVKRDFKESGGKLTPYRIILKRTVVTLTRKFLTLCSLSFISLFSFMLIGIFTSIIGMHTFFPEEFPKDPQMTYLAVAGIICCLFISLYGQAALIFSLFLRLIAIICSIND